MREPHRLHTEIPGAVTTGPGRVHGAVSLAATDPDQLSAPAGLIPLLSALLLLAALAFVSPLAAQDDGLVLQRLGGGRVTEGSLNQPGSTVLVFFTSWSPRCRDIVDRVNAIADSWSGKARVFAVDFQEDADTVRRFLDGKGKLSVPVLLDESGDFSKKYRVNSAPWLLVLKDGRPSFSDKLPADPDRVLSEILR